MSIEEDNECRKLELDFDELEGLVYEDGKYRPRSADEDPDYIIPVPLGCKIPGNLRAVAGGHDGVPIIYYDGFEFYSITKKSDDKKSKK